MARQNYGMNYYNKPIRGRYKAQSSLDSKNIGTRELGPDSMLFGRVVRVNYIYNTVEVVTTRYTERIIKDDASQGRFSAKLPVNFGGSLSNGYSYGQTVPVNVGDLVLLGFVNSDKRAPIVLNIYKDDATSNSLAPTDSVSGNPEDSTIARQALEQFTLYPSQTYELNDGLGGYEKTYQGKSFIKVGSEAFGGSPNDYGYDYDMLYRRTLRDRNIVPTVTSAPDVLFQHTGDDIQILTNLYISNRGELRVSHISKDLDNEERIGFEMPDLYTAKLVYQDGDKESGSEDVTDYAEIGINNKVPTIRNGEHTLTMDKELGIVIDGSSLDDIISGGGGNLGKRLKEIESDISDLQEETSQLKGVDIKQLQDTVDKLNNTINEEINPYYHKLMDDMDKLNEAVGSVVGTATDAKNVAEAVKRTISDAAGEDASLIDRLNRMDANAKSLQEVANEVINARQSMTNNDEVYTSIGVRFDTVQDKLDRWVTDYESLKRKLDVFISQDWGSGITSYVVTVTPSDSTTFKNGVGSTTLSASLYKGGFDWTEMIKPEGFMWTRKSDNMASDMVWNANHETGTRAITITPQDLEYSAIFSVNVVVEGYINN